MSKSIFLHVPSVTVICFAAALFLLDPESNAHTVMPTRQPLPIRVVVVTMFELGEDSGDRPGEFQTWVEKYPLEKTLPFPQGYRDLRYNAEKAVIGIVTGIGTARASASIMALGTDPRFDLTKAYWVVAGISGGDPNDISLGSAAWAEYVIDGDLAHEIDPREMPAGWSTGYLPLRRNVPYELPRAKDDEGVFYHLNPGLVEWAYKHTREVKLEDTDAVQRLRKDYIGYPNAQLPPHVIKGDQLSASTFWHGKLMNDWANNWVSYWTGGKGNFVTSAMEDTGTLQALTFLSKAGKVDLNRVLVLRTVSNYTMPYDGITAAQSLGGEKKGGYSAYAPALQAAYLVGSKVANELLKCWSTCRDRIPQGQ